MPILATKSFRLAVRSQGDEKSHKLALCLPGRFDTKDYTCFDSHLKYLAAKGFLAICFDPPGTWESPGPTSLFTTTNYMKAVNELIDYYGQRPTLLLGHSRGGEVAMLTGTQNPFVSSLVIINGSFGPPSPPSKDQVKNGVVTEYRDLPPGDKRGFRQKKFSYSLNYFTDGAKYDAVSLMKKCRKPKLIFYALHDELNSPARIKKIFAALPEPKTIVELNCSHDYRYDPKIVEKINRGVSQFLKTCL